MKKVSALPLEKFAMHVVVRNILNLNARISQEGPVTQGKGQMEPEKNRCLHRCNVHELHEVDCHDDNLMDGLADQV